MVNRVSTSGAAFLACLAGCLASINPAAVAGDKIEFSPAPDALAVPQSVRAVRQDPADMIKETLSRHHVEASDFNGTASGNYVTIVVPTTTTKLHDHFGWTAPFEQTQDQESDSLDLFAGKKTASSQTNNWSVSTDKDSSLSISKEGSWTKDTPWAQPDRGLARFGVEDPLKSSDQNDGWLSRRFDHHSQGQDWSREFGSSQSKDPVRSGYEGYGQTSEDISAYNRQPFGAFSQSDEGGRGDDAMRAPSAMSKTSLSDWSTESLRSQSDQQQQLQMQPPIAETYDQLPTAAHPYVRSSVRDETYSTQRQGPSAPAVLPFPARPGSLFQ